MMIEYVLIIKGSPNVAIRTALEHGFAPQEYTVCAHSADQKQYQENTVVRALALRGQEARLRAWYEKDKSWPLPDGALLHFETAKAS
jgi:hypothetical protein